jgi:hypothetical protein
MIEEIRVEWIDKRMEDRKDIIRRFPISIVRILKIDQKWWKMDFSEYLESTFVY